MSFTKFLLIGCLIGFTVQQSPLQAQTPDSSKHIYILMGQSNMAGRGKVTEEYQTMGADRLLMLNKDCQWVPASHPLHFDKPSVAGVGPGLSFGLSMLEADTGAVIGLVPCAVGGTSITKWTPGSYDDATSTFPFNDAVIRIMEAMKFGEVKGVIWHQGEGDSRPESAQRYIDRLTDLIERIRWLVGNPTLPVVVGELGRYKEHYDNINSVLPQLQAHIANTIVVSSAGLVHNGDQTHFDSASATTLGERYAAGMLVLQRQLHERMEVVE